MSSNRSSIKAAKGIFWNTIEKLSVQVGQFIIGITLARLLTPNDFGMIAMLTIFMSISQVLAEGGLGTGLIQKKNRTQLDYSTVFLFNIIISAIIYSIIFISAPFIANFYETPQLSPLLRVLALSIVFSSISIVQLTKLTIDIDFKTIAMVNVISMLLAGILGIYCAYNELEVWSLVIYSTSRSFIASILYWSFRKWNLSFKFSKNSFKELFGFGYKLTIASIYSQTLNNIYNLVIGKAYSSVKLGYYNRAKSLTEVSAGTISSIVHQVTFPLLASLQDDKEKMVTLFRNAIRMTAFLIFPSMTLLSLLAEPIINILLTDKWALAIPLLQWMAFTRFFYPLSIINMNILNAIGRSDLFLKLDLIKFPVVVIPMVIALSISVKAMVIAQVIASFISFFINAYLPGKYYNYGPFTQLKDLASILISTAFMAISVYTIGKVFDNTILDLLMSTGIACISFLTSCYLLKVEELKKLPIIIKNMILK